MYSTASSIPKSCAALHQYETERKKNMQEVTAQASTAQPVLEASKNKNEVRKRIWRNRWLYVMIAPGLLYFIIFKYLPMYGLIISFQDYKPYNGIMGSNWVGMKHFNRLFSEPDFLNILKNTIVLFGLNIFIYFPIPIILALMLNELRGTSSNGFSSRSSISPILCRGLSSSPFHLSW